MNTIPQILPWTHFQSRRIRNARRPPPRPLLPFQSVPHHVHRRRQEMLKTFPWVFSLHDLTTLEHYLVRQSKTRNYHLSQAHHLLFVNNKLLHFLLCVNNSRSVLRLPRSHTLLSRWLRRLACLPSPLSLNVDTPLLVLPEQNLLVPSVERRTSQH